MTDRLTATLAIPCYNAEVFIEKTLKAIIDQTRQPEEILVIDDGSSDSSKDIIGRFPQVRLIEHDTNKGIATARNSAISHAQSDIIIFLDADTVPCAEFIEEILKPFSNAHIAGVNGRAIEFVQNNIYDKWRKEILFQEWGNRYREGVYFLFGMCAAYRKEVLKEVQGFDTLFSVSGEDMDISYRIRKAGYTLAYTPKAFVHHLREDSYETIKKMTFRHCFWGFLAQKKNNCYQNKIPLWKSAFLFVKHLFYNGIIIAQPKYAKLSFELHLIIAKAWIKAGQEKKVLSDATNRLQGSSYDWEGHGKK